MTEERPNCNQMLARHPEGTAKTTKNKSSQKCPQRRWWKSLILRSQKLKGELGADGPTVLEGLQSRSKLSDIAYATTT